jgi:hypothetical protein
VERSERIKHNHLQRCNNKGGIMITLSVDVENELMARALRARCKRLNISLLDLMGPWAMDQASDEVGRIALSEASVAQAEARADEVEQDRIQAIIDVEEARLFEVDSQTESTQEQAAEDQTETILE